MANKDYYIAMALNDDTILATELTIKVDDN